MKLRLVRNLQKPMPEGDGEEISVSTTKSFFSDIVEQENGLRLLCREKSALDQLISDEKPKKHRR